MYNGQQRARRQQAFETQALEVPMDEYDAYGLPSVPQAPAQQSPRPSSNSGSGFLGKLRKFGGSSSNIEDDPDEFGAGTLPADGQFPDLSIKDLNGIRDRHRYPTFDENASSGDAASTNGRTMSLTSVGAFDTTPIIPTFGPGGIIPSNNKAKSQHLQYRQNMIDARRQLLSSDLGVQQQQQQQQGQPRTHTMGNMRRPTMSGDNFSMNSQMMPLNGHQMQQNNSPRTMSLGNPRSRGSRQNGPAFAPNMQLLPHHQHQQYASPGPHPPSQLAPGQQPQGFYQAQGYHSQANFHAQGSPMQGQGPFPPQGQQMQGMQGQQMQSQQMQSQQMQSQQMQQAQHTPQPSGQQYQAQPGVRSPLSHNPRGSHTFEKHQSASSFSYENPAANTPMDDKSTMTETSAADLVEEAANAAAAIKAANASASEASAAAAAAAGTSHAQTRSIQQRPRDIMYNDSGQVNELLAANKQLQEEVRILSIELAESTRRELQLDPQNETSNLAAELAHAQKELALERQKRMAAEGYGYVSESDMSTLELENRHAETTQLLEMRSHENEQLREMAETAKRDVATLHDQNKSFQTQVRDLQVTQGKGDVDELRRQVDMVQTENKKLQELLDQSVEQGSVAERLKRTEEQRDVLQSTVRTLRERKDQEVSMLQGRISQLESHMDLIRSAVPRASSASGGVSRSANNSFDTSFDTSADYPNNSGRELTINTALAHEAANSLEPPRMRAHGRPASPLTLNFDLNYRPTGPTRVTSRTSPVPLALSGN